MAKLHSKLSASPYQANRAVALVSAVWNWAARRDEVSFADNPARAVERFTEAGRERFLTSEELARLGDVLREGETFGLPYAVDETKAKAKNAPEAGKPTRQAGRARGRRHSLAHPDRRSSPRNSGRAMVATGPERGVLFLPDSKTGKKPALSQRRRSIRAGGIPRIKDNPHIIAGAARALPAPICIGLGRPLRKAANLDGVRIHDLRHSFASFGAGASLGLPIIGKLLGHSQAATTHRYAHLDADPLRRAAETIGNTIAAAMDNQSVGRVVPFKSRQP